MFCSVFLYKILELWYNVFIDVLISLSALPMAKLPQATSTMQADCAMRKLLTVRRLTMSGTVQSRLLLMLSTTSSMRLIVISVAQILLQSITTETAIRRSIPTTLRMQIRRKLITICYIPKLLEWIYLT